MKKVLSDILKKISTEEDLIFFLEELEKLESIAFEKPKRPLLEKAKGKIGYETFSLLKKWEKEKIIPSSPESQSLFFQKIEEELKNLPRMKIKISFSPSKDFISRLKKKIKDLLNNREVILDISVDHQIVGGAIIEYQGKYFDDSLSKKIKIKRLW